ncbi:hypothetical protein [Streptomyces himalayensis]|uniref:Uncharacterized protein n=1 Tax=Streptomyces himalayensis subsp. himalayensis TaxID=2756131 RepID=A0A7W0DKH8_9ACTN|nr:hypothetical protein [Streptomyces himalayensis]MBA2946721.1 hypothetical protein [Streptomyces himalayensis subsp. himalayensis]
MPYKLPVGYDKRPAAWVSGRTAGAQTLRKPPTADLPPTADMPTAAVTGRLVSSLPGAGGGGYGACSLTW